MREYVELKRIELVLFVKLRLVRICLIKAHRQSLLRLYI